MRLISSACISRLLAASLLLAAFVVSILLPCLASAAVSVTIRLDRKEATLADAIRMVVSVSGARSSDSKPVLHGLESFHITGGGTSSRLEIINGQVNAGIDFTYFIQPKKTGTFEIGPAEMAIDDSVFKSNTEKLSIADASRSSGIDRGPVFLTAELSSGEVYEEEQTIYTLKLYRKFKVSDVSLDLPETEHLAFRQLAKPLEYQSVHDGQSYQVLEVRYALIPSREGDYTVRPSKMSMTVYKPGSRRGRSLFDDPFFSFSTGRPMTLSSDTADLKVLPLPKEGRPADFSGLVGTFQVESTLEPSEIKAGESATLTVLLKGRGNVNRIPDLKMPELDHAKLYADQPVLEVEAEYNGLGGSKTMKWALVPEKEGLYQIPPLTVSFFDTKSKQYRFVRTSPFSLSALPGDEKQVQASVNLGEDKTAEGPAKQAIKELGRDILPVHASIRDLEPSALARPGGLVLWVLLAAPFCLYAITFCGIRYRKKSAKGSALTRTKKAAVTFARKCRQGELSSSDLAEAIQGYLNDRFGLSLGSLTPGEAFEILTSRGVSPDAAQKLQGILQRLEDDIYSGGGQDACDIGEGIPKLIKQIEKEIQ